MYHRPLRIAFGALAFCVVALSVTSITSNHPSTTQVALISAPTITFPDLAPFKALDQQAIDQQTATDIAAWNAAVAAPPPTEPAPPPPPKPVKEAAAPVPVPETAPAPAEAPVGPSSGSAEDAVRLYFGDVFDKAWAVSGCESGHDPGAISPGGGNWGLFQINSVHKKDFENYTGQPWNSGVLNASFNAQYARKLYDSSGWGPWTCKYA